jgi:hypothetical protein
LAADQIETGLEAGTFGWDLADGNSGRDQKIAGAYGTTRNSQQPTARAKKQPSVKI